jgi:3-oxoacid CoA-transferase
MDKVYASADEAVADIADGASVAISGFGIGHRFPTTLIVALRDHGARQLSVICNSLGAPGQLRAQILAENGQISRLVTAFSARPGMRSEAEGQIARGEVELELVSQGLLVERLRAGAAGVPAYYSPTGVDTVLGEGKEVREFDGRPYVLETALRPDFAFLRAHRADRYGNLEFRGGSQNFNPVFGKAANVAIAEADEIVDVGEIPPDKVGLPGAFVARVVLSTVKVDVTASTTRPGRGADTFRRYFDKPAITRSAIARRAARLLPDGSVVNLGVGIPTLVSNCISDRDIMLHAENGILGYGPLVDGDAFDPDIYNAGGGFVSLRPGASFFDSTMSFDLAHAGALDAVILGGYQVDEAASLANWSTPDMVGGGIGGAMDLVSSGGMLIVLMEHLDSMDRPKLVRECTYPLTGRGCVDIVITDLALFRRRGDRIVLDEIAPGFSLDEVRSLTEMSFDVAPDVKLLRGEEVADVV